jgi:hypothetical protein
MLSTLKPPTLNDLPVKKKPDSQQLDNIKAHLDLILLALESLADITSDTIITTAKQLNIDSKISNRVDLWRWRQANPLRKSSGGRKKLDIEEAKSLVLIICYLANKNQELIRRGVTLLEESITKGQPVYKITLLADYIDKFTNTYQERMEENENSSAEKIEQLGIKLLIDLLFYSDKNGHRRLWLALLDYAKK